MDSFEELKEQSNRIKLKVNTEVEAIFDNFMKISREESSKSDLKIAKLKGLMARMDWLKRTKESICD